MNEQEAKNRIAKLKKLIWHHNYLYHVLDRPELSDAAFDTLKNELEELEGKFPQFVAPDSPTQRVSGQPLDKFEKFKHPRPMLSFNDAFGQEELQDWEQRIKKILPSAAKDGYYCELKIDGLAIELIYRQSVLAVGSTRGDGKIGEDITQNLKTIPAVPLRLLEPKQVGENLKKAGLGKMAERFFKKMLSELVVRGEVFISRKEFEKINRQQQKKGEKVYANPRNLAAGSVRQLDPKITASRHLDFFLYDLVTDLGQRPQEGYYGVKTHEQKHQILKALGFKTNPHNEFKRNLQEVMEFHKRWEKEREKLAYEIDGIVVIVNDNLFFEKLGVVGKAPRGAVAYKFSPKEATTKVKDIILQVGRTGILTPVAVLVPVSVAGVTISRATLHNFDQVKRLGLKIGDTVIVGRAGDVIPDIKKVIFELRSGREKYLKAPKKCPMCSGRVVRKIIGQGKEQSAAYFCENKSCYAVNRRRLMYFVSKPAINIEGLGPKIIEQLMREGLVRRPADFYRLKEGDLEILERFAQKSSRNLIEAIAKSREIELERFINALGILHVGQETAILLAGLAAKNFKKKNIRPRELLDFFQKISLDKLEEIPDIGPVVARSIFDWFHHKNNAEELSDLDEFISLRLPAISRGAKKLQGQTFVLTGELESLTREQARAKIKELGGDVSSSVSGRTDFVLAGASPGSKYDRAKELGVKIVEEEEFLRIIQ